MSNSNVNEKEEIYTFPSSHSLFSSVENRNPRKYSDICDSQHENSLEKVSENKQTLMFGSVNLFEETYKKKEYSPKQKQYLFSTKKKTHNKSRLCKNYPQSSIHFTTPFFNESSLDQLTTFLQRSQPRTQQQKFIFQNFYLQK